VEKTYPTLVKRIRDAVRKKAKDIPKFRDEGNGAIRILAYPGCKEADNWLGGLSDFVNPCDPFAAESKKRDDITDYEHTFAITPGGSRVITGIWDGVKQDVDCYAFSALKIAHCSRAQDLGLGLLSGIDMNDPNITEENGYGPYSGALCVEVMRKVSSTSSTNFCGIYVCVSGATSAEDLECALVAVDVIKEFFEDESGDFEFNAPEIPE